jgi:hypothetical protein
MAPAEMTKRFFSWQVSTHNEGEDNGTLFAARGVKSARMLAAARSFCEVSFVESQRGLGDDLLAHPKIGLCHEVDFAPTLSARWSKYARSDGLPPADQMKSPMDEPPDHRCSVR